jgi:hypothetical protein
MPKQLGFGAMSSRIQLSLDTQHGNGGRGSEHHIHVGKI